MRRVRLSLVLLGLGLVLWIWPVLVRLPASFIYYKVRPWFGLSDSACRMRLQAGGVVFRPHQATSEQRHEGCFLIEGMAIPWEKVDYVYSLSTDHKFSLTASCSFLEDLLNFEAETLQPLAQTHFHQRLRWIFHKGAYSCRSQEDSWVLSEHAYGEAIDLSEFELEDGKRFSVTEYLNLSSPYRPFLFEVAQSACKKFGTILTPAFDAHHQEHFHISRGIFGRCVY